MRSMTSILAVVLLTVLVGALLLPGPCAAAEKADTPMVGVALVDITPSYSIRLSGFGSRRTESEGVTQRIWAKALAIGADDKQPAILICVDNLGVPAKLVQEVADRLAKKAKIQRPRLAVCASHTHTAPMLTGVCPTLFGEPISKEHQEHIDRYTAEFTDNLEKVALAALADRKPARLSWGVGTVGFAVNRRTKGGPVDHDLPTLVVRDLNGKVRAVYVSYACHCVTLSNNKISGDWAGYAQQSIQDEYPGAIALVSIGCGADSNPSSGVTGDHVEKATLQGREIAAEVKRLVNGWLAPVTGNLETTVQTIELPLDNLPTREQWTERAENKKAIGHHARVNLARLDRGEALRTKIDYPIQTWSFGNSLAMVFLAGEVVVDYSLRLKGELDGRRLWINAYSNDAPCYIPSERILKEGGYEGGGAMIYYDVPAPFQSGLEKKIVDAAQHQIGKSFPATFDAHRILETRPLSPQQSLATMQTKKNLAVEIMAAEPLVIDPVAIEWGPDGRLWVAEMNDYPAGRLGDYKPGGRIRVLEDTDGDGKYDKATLFLDNIPFPTGLTAWRKGVLVCAAPDILYAEDTDGDGKADVVRKLFNGFGADNYQARVNSLHYGLDGWVYGSCGLFGGKIKSFAGGEPVNLGNRDFRIKPDSGILEPATGRTQQGRVRDDWDDWFGCDNTTPCRHYPLADHYLRRNPHIAPPDSGILIRDNADPNRLYPIKQIQLFKLSGPANRPTAACGLGIYRDDLLGSDFTGNVFTCEPVNLLVHRLRLTPKGSTFEGHRAADEASSEFLATTDNWSRFVQARTGPDGCLWVVDMYRFVIEHPRWIPPEELAKLDVRAGHTMGRIYRIRPNDRVPRPLPKLDKLDGTGLVAALDSPNGWQRDMASQMLSWRGDNTLAPALEKMATTHARAESRLHALCALDGLGELKPAIVQAALADKHAGVRRHAVRLSEKLLAANPDLGKFLAKLDDSDAQVRLQLAYSLGEWHDARSGRALASLAMKNSDDPYLTIAVLSSVNRDNIAEVFPGVFAGGEKDRPPEQLLRKLLRVAIALGDKQTLPGILGNVTTPSQERYAPWQMAVLPDILDALERRGQPLEKLANAQVRQQVARMSVQARVTAADDKAAEADRLTAIAVLGRETGERFADFPLLESLLMPQNSAALQSAAVTALGRISDNRIDHYLLTGWKGHSPALKSQILDLMLSRDAWQRQLLHSIEKNEVPAAQIDAPRRQRLLNHKDEQVRALAAKLFSGATSVDRQAVLQTYREAVSLTGDGSHGKAVFTKSCSVCHRLQDVGFTVGPDLAALTNKSPQFLMMEILDPNRNVDTRFLEYQAVKNDGRTYTGMLASESATSITLRGQEGKEQVLLRGDLEELRSTGKSMMPEGLEKDLSKQDMADLLAFLAGAGGSPKQFPGNSPAVVKPVDDILSLLATNGEIFGGAIVFEQPFRNIGFWQGVQDHVTWSVHLEKEGRYDVYLDWACADPSAGNAFVLSGGNTNIRGKVDGTGGWDKYRQRKIGTLTLAAGQQRLTLRPEGDTLKGALLDLRGLYLVPEGRKPTLGKEVGK